MDYHNILPIITLLSMVVGSHASTSPETYWKNVFPNTPMPLAIRNSLPHDWTENKGTSVDVGKGGVYVDTHKPSGGHTHVDVSPKGGVGVYTGKPSGGHTDVSVGPKGGVGVTTGKPGGGHTDVSVGPKGGVGVHTNKPGKGGATVGVGKGGVVVTTGPKRKPVFVGVTPGPNPFSYIYAASETQLQDDPTRALFFLEKNMKVGSHVTLHFTKSLNDATFLTRDEASDIPFSSEKMPEILRQFSLESDSPEAKIMKSTVEECESKGIQGEKKYCATSIESMVDYVTSTLGKSVKAISTVGHNNNNEVERYTITGLKKTAKEDKNTVCHKENYPYAVFYCHKTTSTSSYVVSLVGSNGSWVKAVAVCHKDTSGWNPKHLAFQVLGVKPGSVPICHFLPEDHIVWVPNN